MVLPGNRLGITHIGMLGREEDRMVGMSSSAVHSEGIIVVVEMVLTIIAMVEDVIIRNAGSKIGAINIGVLAAERVTRPSKEVVLDPSYVDHLRMPRLFLPLLRPPYDPLLLWFTLVRSCFSCLAIYSIYTENTHAYMYFCYYYAYAFHSDSRSNVFFRTHIYIYIYILFIYKI